MKNLRVKKLPIFLPLAVLAAVLAAAGIMARLGQDSPAAHTNLGQKYLNDMNYTGAITEFLQTLSLDPTDQDARLGLAEAYIASGSPDMAGEILSPLVEANAPQAYRLLIDGLRTGDPRQALLTAEALVDHTDDEEDYALLEELLTLVLAEPHSYAVGTDQRLALAGGSVLSAGSNTLGQLGTDQGLATDTAQTSLLSAGFPGQAVRVYCAGRTSYVVDASGDLWAAGENRWGQMGQTYLDMEPQSGWSKIVDSGDVAAAAGTAGTLFVLRTNGSLWYAGQGGVMDLTRVEGLGTVTAVASNDWMTAALTADGLLYSCNAQEPLRWTRQAKQVKNFSLNSNGLIWVTSANEIGSQSGFGQTPDAWSWSDQGAVPDFSVRDAAGDGQGLLLLGADGLLRRMYDGQIYEAADLSVSDIYAAGSQAVVELADGNTLLWDLSQTDPQPLA